MSSRPSPDPPASPSPASAVGASPFDSRWVELPPGARELDPGLLAPGFLAGSAACGLKAGGALDVGILACEASEVASAILLTRNAAAAAPVRLCREQLDAARIGGVVVNAGNANAATGERGMRDAEAMRDAAAGLLELEPDRVAVAQTGVIGVPLPLEAVLGGVREAGAALAASGAPAFAEAITTTDRFAKACAVEAAGVTLTVQAKGAGMMMPGFATLLCFAQTDAVVEDPEAELRRAAAGSFERISVDGQMSTNDTLLLQASGASGRPLPPGLLDAALLALALRVLADGEGATRVARASVEEAADAGEAERVARAIANSPLVKTALFGRDPNWGRISQAAGMALAGERLAELGPERVDALELGSDAEEAEISVRLGRGSGAAHVYLSDLSHDYVSLNAEYTT